MSKRVVENKDYLIDVVALTVAVAITAAGGRYVTQVVKAKLSYRQYKKTRATMAV